MSSDDIKYVIVKLRNCAIMQSCNHATIILCYYGIYTIIQWFYHAINQLSKYTAIQIYIYAIIYGIMQL